MIEWGPFAKILAEFGIPGVIAILLIVVLKWIADYVKERDRHNDEERMAVAKMYKESMDRSMEVIEKHMKECTQVQNKLIIVVEKLSATMELNTQQLKSLEKHI